MQISLFIPSLAMIPLYLLEFIGPSSTWFVYHIYIEYFNICISESIHSLYFKYFIFHSYVFLILYEFYEVLKNPLKSFIWIILKSQSRDRTCMSCNSCVACRYFTHWTTEEAQLKAEILVKNWCYNVTFFLPKYSWYSLFKNFLFNKMFLLCS